MKARNACLPCMIAQAYNTAKRCTKDEGLIREILDETMRRYIGVRLDDQSPALLSQIAYETCRELSGVADPYASEKRAANTAAMALYPQLRQRLDQAADALREALILALAGNVIDLATTQEYDLQKSVVAQLERGFDVAEMDAFREAVTIAQRILYIADNAGEIVFDRLLIETLGPQRVTLMIKGGPIVNDALYEDAVAVGLADLVRVVDTGTNYFGFPWEYVSDEARAEFLAADCIIAKGHANFETISELGSAADKAWYLLKVKCAEVARLLRVRVGNIVLLSNQSLRLSNHLREE